MSSPRDPVRLGMRDGESIFKTLEGLHAPVAGVAVVGGSGSEDPEIMFEEHGTDQVCRYFADWGPDASLNEALGPSQPRPDIRARIESNDLRDAWHAVRAAFALEEAAFVNEMVRRLRGDYEPGGGAVSLISITARFQHRISVIRMLHTARAQPERPWENIISGPYPLEHHAAGADLFRADVYVPLVLLASPFTRGFVGGRGIQEASETVLLVALRERDKGAVLRDADVVWRSVYEDTLPTMRVIDGQGTTWLRQTNHRFTQLDGRLLIDWWTGQLNALFTEATDLGRFRDTDGQFDSGNAYRELRTLDRILGNCVRIQVHPDEHASRVSVAFEFFDLLPNILDKPIGPLEVWATLANPSKAGKILHESFADVPVEIRTILDARVDAVLARLRNETLEHVMPGRRGQGRVIVGAARERKLQADDFVAKLLHQLRNTHHGYELDEEGKRDLLDTHTGHISEAFPELVVLYVLAILSRPRKALGGGWF